MAVGKWKDVHVIWSPSTQYHPSLWLETCHLSSSCSGPSHCVKSLLPCLKGLFRVSWVIESNNWIESWWLNQQPLGSDVCNFRQIIIEKHWLNDNNWPTDPLHSQWVINPERDLYFWHFVPQNNLSSILVNNWLSARLIFLIAALLQDGSCFVTSLPVLKRTKEGSELNEGTETKPKCSSSMSDVALNVLLLLLGWVNSLSVLLVYVRGTTVWNRLSLRSVVLATATTTTTNPDY